MRPTSKFKMQWISITCVCALCFLQLDMTSSQTMRIVSVSGAPYLTREWDVTSQRAVYSGYIKDLLDELMRALGLRYELYLAPDGQYGHLQPGRVWSGMINELLKTNADIAAAPLYVTFPRASVVDFTRPFMNVSATFLTLRSTQHAHAKTPQDIVNDPNMYYGTLQVSTIMRAFKTTNHSLYRQIWQRMQSFSPHVFTNSNSEGIERVRSSNGRYAFIVPSDIGEYVAAQAPCDVTTVGSFLNERHFALAVPKDSVFLAKLNTALLYLEQTGFLRGLYKKWWFRDSPCVVSNNYSRSQLQSSNSHNSYSSCVNLALFCFMCSRILLLL